MTSDNEKYKRLRKQIEKCLIEKKYPNYKDIGGSSLTFFAKFMYLRAKDEIPEIDKFYKLDIKGMSAFIVIPKNLGSSTTIRDKIIEKYELFVKEIIQIFEKSEYFEELSKEDKLLWKDWTESLIHPINQLLWFPIHIKLL